jgi:hypothetical protein
MPIPFSTIITPYGMSFSDPDGMAYHVSSGHNAYCDFRRRLGQAQSAAAAGDNDGIKSAFLKLKDLATRSKIPVSVRSGRVAAINDQVLYDGTVQSTDLTNRIKWLLANAFDAAFLMNFLDDLMNNPSRRVINKLYAFMEHHRMGITHDGKILAFTVVPEGVTDHVPGTVISKPRNQVNDDPVDRWGDDRDVLPIPLLSDPDVHHDGRRVIVKVAPCDVVLLPSDIDSPSLTCCRYEVVGDYDGVKHEGPSISSGNLWDVVADDDELGVSCERCGVVTGGACIQCVLIDDPVCSRCGYDSVCEEPGNEAPEWFAEPADDESVDAMARHRRAMLDDLGAAPTALCGECPSVFTSAEIDRLHTEARKVTFYRDPFSGEYIPTDSPRAFVPVEDDEPSDGDK